MYNPNDLPSLDNLPKEIFKEILFLLEPLAALRLRKTSKKLQTQIDQTKVWQVLFEKYISQHVKPCGKETYKGLFLKHYPNVLKIYEAFEVNKQNIVKRLFRLVTNKILNRYEAVCLILEGGYEIVSKNIFLQLDNLRLGKLDPRLTIVNIVLLIIENKHEHFLDPDIRDHIFAPKFKTAFKDHLLTVDNIVDLLNKLPEEKTPNLDIFLKKLAIEFGTQYLIDLWVNLVIRITTVTDFLQLSFSQLSAEVKFTILWKFCCSIGKDILFAHQTTFESEENIAKLDTELRRTGDDDRRNNLRNEIKDLKNITKLLDRLIENKIKKFSALLTLSKDVFDKFDDFSGQTLFLKALEMPFFHYSQGPEKSIGSKSFASSTVPQKYKDYYKQILTVLVKNSQPVLVPNSQPLTIFDISNKFGLLPLHAALEDFYFEEIRDFFTFFLDLQPNLNIQNKKGQTVLHLSAGTFGNNFVWQELIKRGANLNIKDLEGNTPLHAAILEKNLPFAVFLLKNNVDITIVSPKGTPLELVMQLEQSLAKDPNKLAPWQKFRLALQKRLKNLPNLDKENKHSQEQKIAKEIKPAEFTTDTVKKVQFWSEEKTSAEGESTHLPEEDKANTNSSPEYLGPSNI